MNYFQDQNYEVQKENRKVLTYTRKEKEQSIVSVFLKPLTLDYLAYKTL